MITLLCHTSTSRPIPNVDYADSNERNAYPWPLSSLILPVAQMHQTANVRTRDRQATPEVAWQIYCGLSSYFYISQKPTAVVNVRLSFSFIRVFEASHSQIISSHLCSIITPLLVNLQYSMDTLVPLLELQPPNHSPRVSASTAVARYQTFLFLRVLLIMKHNPAMPSTSTPTCGQDEGPVR